jgi:hypothetical protein
MRSSQPPAGATWLLERFNFGRRNDALIGDLIEEYGNGRSGAWYWRQALTTVAVAFCQEIRAHKVLAVRAVVTGWAVWYVYQRFASSWVDGILIYLRQMLPPAIQYKVSFGFVWWIIWLSVRAASGWTVARLHRGHQTAMVLLFSASVLLWKLRMLPLTFMVVGDAFGNSIFFPYLASRLASIILPPISILAGGLFGVPPESEPPTESMQVATQPQ